MAELDFWHPVALSEELGSKPRPVVLAGRSIALFRTESGRAAALGDVCPHRGMQLSCGAVRGEELVCPYHGWGWAPDGAGTSPGNLKVTARAEAYAVVERHGAVWIRRAGSEAPFPSLGTNGHHEVCRKRHRVAAPLELVLDNFIEVEHTGEVHLLFGYPTERMHEVESEVIAEDERVRVINRGPQRPIPPPLRQLFGIEPGDVFVDDWTTHFGPVYTVYDQYWQDPESGERRPDALRIAVFFNPIDDQHTELFTFAYSAQPPWGRLGLNLLLRRVTALFVDLEIGRDVRAIEKLADRRVELKGNALGRFDKALMAARKRIDRLYRGRAVTPSRIG